MTTEDRVRPSVLIVDDTVDNLRFLARVLEEQGYEARPVTSGRQALEAIRHAPPDLVLLDVHMPEMDGYEVCRQLRQQEHASDVPVLFLSALSETADKVRAFDAGGVDYITKPFQVEEVLSRVRTHLALRRAHLDLASSYERLRSLEEHRDNLVHMMVHDIRSPLMVLMSNLELLTIRPDVRGEPELTQDLQAAISGAEAIRRLVDNLLDVRRLEEGKMPIDRTPCDLSDFARRIRDSYRGVQPSREIELVADGPVEASCDRGLVWRVLENLVGNGIKHTRPDGRLWIHVARLEDLVRVEVRDEGPGVPARAREEIFEVFGTLRARADQTYQSTGLGLAFCKLAVEAHQGAIGVDDREEGGSTFWFELPLAAP